MISFKVGLAVVLCGYARDKFLLHPLVEALVMNILELKTGSRVFVVHRLCGFGHCADATAPQDLSSLFSQPILVSELPLSRGWIEYIVLQ